MSDAPRGPLQVSKGTVIFRQGDPGDEMFIVESGRVRLLLTEDRHEREIAAVGPGEFFGELSLLIGEPRSATAEAAEDATLIRIRRNVFAMMMKDDLEIVFRMMNVLGRRLGQTDAHVRALAQRFGRLRVMLHCLAECSATPNGSDCRVAGDAIAASLGLGASDAHAALEVLAAAGAGAMQSGGWVAGPNAAPAILAALQRVVAAVPTDPPVVPRSNS